MVQANKARIEANRLKREQEAEARRAKKAAKAKTAPTKTAKSNSAAVSGSDNADKVIVHFDRGGSSYGLAEPTV